MEPRLLAARARRLRYAAAAVLLLGLFAAELVYMFAADDSDAAAEIARGRMYQHNLQLMGGKAAILFDSFDQWFDGLWHGRGLAYTVGVLSIVVAAALYVAARLCEPATPRR